jgi:hypothetical protein
MTITLRWHRRFHGKDNDMHLHRQGSARERLLYGLRRRKGKYGSLSDRHATVHCITENAVYQSILFEKTLDLLHAFHFCSSGGNYGDQAS